MNMFGFLLACFAGLIGGLAPAPLKGIKHFEYEHWGLLVGLFGYLVFPWTFVFCICPDAFAAIAELPLKPMLIGNAFSLAWGIANILYLICMVKIGFSLAQGILVGIAIPAGVMIPMVLKGSGKFANAPDIFSLTGLFIIVSVIMMLAAVVLLSKAGFGREKAIGKTEDQGLGTRDQGLGTRDQGLGTRDQGLGTRDQGLGTRDQGLGTRDQGLGTKPESLEASESGSGRARRPATAADETESETENYGLRTKDQGLRTKNQEPETFSKYLIMSVLAGLLSIGISFSFVYTENLITEVFAKHGMSETFRPAAVRTVTLTGGGILNVLYPLFLLAKNRSWKRFACQHNVREMLFALIMAAVTTASVVMASTSMVLLGALGSSVGFGIGQSMQLAGSQCIACATGEWHGVPKKHIRQLIVAMILLFAAVGMISVLS